MIFTYWGQGVKQQERKGNRVLLPSATVYNTRSHTSRSLYTILKRRRETFGKEEIGETGGIWRREGSDDDEGKAAIEDHEDGKAGYKWTKANIRRRWYSWFPSKNAGPEIHSPNRQLLAVTLTLSMQILGWHFKLGKGDFLQYLSFTNGPQSSHTTGINQYTRAVPRRLHVRFPHLDLHSIIFLHILLPKVRNQNFTQYSGHEFEKFLRLLPKICRSNKPIRSQHARNIKYWNHVEWLGEYF